MSLSVSLSFSLSLFLSVCLSLSLCLSPSISLSLSLPIFFSGSLVHVFPVIGSEIGKEKPNEIKQKKSSENSFSEIKASPKGTDLVLSYPSENFEINVNENEDDSNIENKNEKENKSENEYGNESRNIEPTREKKLNIDNEEDLMKVVKLENIIENDERVLDSKEEREKEKEKGKENIILMRTDSDVEEGSEISERNAEDDILFLNTLITVNEIIPIQEIEKSGTYENKNDVLTGEGEKIISIFESKKKFLGFEFDFDFDISRFLGLKSVIDSEKLDLSKSPIQLKGKSNDEKEQNLDVLSEKVSEDDLSLPSSTFLSLSFPNTDEKNNLLLVSNELNNNNNDFNNVVRTRAYSYSDQELELEEKGEIDAVKDFENVEINNISFSFFFPLLLIKFLSILFISTFSESFTASISSFSSSSNS